MAQSKTAYPAFEQHTFTSHRGFQLSYRLMPPLQVDTSRRYPLVLGLHGAGSRGESNEKILKHLSPIFLADTNRSKYPCYVLIPQCPKDQQWVTVPWTAASHTLPQQPSEPLAASLALLDSLTKVYPIDTTRLYLIGFSMGGFGVWDAAMRFPYKFAAAIPICGGGDETAAHRIQHLPMWVFHGMLDKTVQPLRSIHMVEKLKQLGGKPRYTWYPTVAHTAWKQAFKEPDLLPWLFRQKNSK
ncbi:MAG: dienelactone hydrolase family protein [Thermonemataceae bacterium]